MSDRPTDNFSGNTDFDRRGEGQGPTQRQEQFDPTTRDPRFDNQQGGDPFQDTSQSTDPNLGRRDPASDQFDRQDRSIGTGGGHVRDPLGQQGHRDQLRQGGQTGLDSVPYGGGGDRDPRQTGNRTGQVVGGPQERFEPSGNYGTSTGTGPGARPGDYDIHGDGGFGKPTLPERVIGTTEKVIGKATGNPGMYQQGHEHKTGGY